MIEPELADDALLADIVAASRTPAALHLWWLGQSGFLIQWDKQVILLDPYLSDSLTRKYAETDKPHVRMTRRAMDPSRLDMVQVVTSSHNHTDHLDADTLRPMLDANPQLQVLVPSANRAFAADRLGVAAERLQVVDAGESCTLPGTTIHAVPAAHEQIDRDEQGRCHYLGYVVQLGPYRIYHSGDTVRYQDQVTLLRPWEVDLALLPINGRGPERRVSGNLWGREAAALAADIGARHVIPCHYDMFTFNTAAPDEFVETCRSLDQPCTVLRCGQRFTWPLAT